MTPIFAESFFFFALVNPRDAAHRKAVDFSDKYDGPLVIITLNMPDSKLYSNEPAHHSEFTTFVIGDAHDLECLGEKRLDTGKH